jgi:16S rRNA (adenine1518-N6/adenine1519-N6)-dimethyltransferase
MLLEMNTNDVKKLLGRIGLKAEKSLGQHFLVDDRIADRSVSYADVSSDDTVLEIGPGLGILTRLLTSRAREVVAIEKDPRLIGVVDSANLVYINGDALKVKLPRFDKVVSNLPYGISSPVTFRLLGDECGFKVAVLMYQKEFAERLAAGPGSKTYSRISVSAYVKARVELLDTIPNKAFYPRPKVDSSIVRLLPREPPFSTEDWALFHNVVKTAFGQRRKKLRNSLKHGVHGLGIPVKDRIDFDKVPYKDERPERLTPEQFAEVADYLYNA